VKRVFFFLGILGVCLANPHKVIDFSYLKAKMPKMNSELLDIHLKLYSGYVKQVNFIDEQICKENDSFMLQSLRKQYGFEWDGMALHELYFSSLGGNGKLPKHNRIVQMITLEFGSFDSFKEKVTSYAKTRGIGWVILFAEVDSGDIKLSWVQDHEKGFLSGFVPVMVVDLWEHAYISQFGLDKNAYVDLIFEYTDWSTVNSRYINGCKSLKNSYKKLYK
jgi:superoxide dismutase, Fe-Mn family